MQAAALLLFLASVSPKPLTTLRYEDRDHLVFLSVRIDGSRPLTFVLDSGAPHSVVDSSTAVALKLRAMSDDRTGASGRGTVGRQHLPPLVLHVGDVRLRVADPWAIDLRHVGLGPIDGLVGADLFKQYVVQVNPESRTLTLYDPADS